MKEKIKNIWVDSPLKKALGNIKGNLSIRKTKKRILHICIPLCLVAVIAVSVYANGADTVANSEATNQYKEETVELKDIVVGVTEMGTANLNALPISFDFDVVLDEIFVKSGEIVNEGDLLATINLDEEDDTQQAYQDEVDAKQNELDSARLDLQKVLLSTESEKYNAEKKLADSTFTGEQAGTLQGLNLSELESGLAKIANDINNLNEDKLDIEDEMLYGYDGSTDIDTSYSDIYNYESQIANINAEINHAQVCNNIVTPPPPTSSVPTIPESSEPPVTGDEDTTSEITLESNEGVDVLSASYSTTCTNPNMNHNISELQAEITQLESKITTSQNQLNQAYNTSQDQYETWLEQTEDSLETVIESIEKKEMERDEYLVTMELKEYEIDSNYDEDLYEYDNADRIYDNSIAIINNEISKAQDKVSQIEEELQSLELITTDENILAPQSGYVMSISESSNIKAGAEILSIADTKFMNVLVSIPQEDIADIEIGMETNVIFDAYDEITVPALVDSISIVPASGMQTTVNYTVSILCDITGFQDMVIYEGMTSDVTFVQKQKKDVLVVSNKCIITEDGKQYAKIKNAEGIIEQIPVKTGFSDGFDVEITEGLQEGDIVIIESAVISNATK